MHLYRTREGIVIKNEAEGYLLEEPWTAVINRDNLYHILEETIATARPLEDGVLESLLKTGLLPPIDRQEVWAAGVTYLQSRDARMEEAKAAGGGDFYDRVYDAPRPELFFKSLPHRVAGDGQAVYIREDSSWNVPEPELTLFINRKGDIAGYTVGNDMSSRSIEGENPLYLPQAKVYERSAALGPCLFVPAQPLPADTTITMDIRRGDQLCFSGEIQISQMKRSLTELAAYLNRGFDFPEGCFLMTGTCLVPGNDFTLMPGDTVAIRIQYIGLLTNTVEWYKKRQ